jgi:hypothetical protein
MWILGNLLRLDQKIGEIGSLAYHPKQPPMYNGFKPPDKSQIDFVRPFGFIQKNCLEMQ